jgi:PAS domain S-box-containing protein
MIDENKYEALLKDYRTLQLKFTRFSAVEQELINARDRIDQELELYKRLQQYSYEALVVKSPEALFHLISEALIDVLELECSIVYYRDLVHQTQSSFIIEGDKIFTSTESIKDELLILCESNKYSKVLSLKSEDLKTYSQLSLLHTAIMKSVKEKELGYELYFFVGISIQNQRTYQPIAEKHLNIFDIFVNQMQSVIANKKKNETIENQIRQISKSQTELKKLSLIATKSKSGVIISDAYGQIEWVNEAFTNLTGYTLEEVIGLKPKDFLHGPETTAAAKKQLSDALRAKKGIDIVLINRNKAGKPYYNQLEIIPVFDDQGKHINFIAIQKDITAEINYNQEIIKINSRFEQIASFSQIGIWEHDLKTGKNSWNKELTKILGIPSADSNKDVFEIWQKLIHPDNKNAVIENFQKIRQGELKYYRHEYSILRYHDHAIRNIQSLLIAEQDETGQLVRLIGSIQDITEVKSLQLNLEHAITDRDKSLEKINEIKVFYERILKNSPTQILVFDQTLSLTFSNTDHLPIGGIWKMTEGTALKSVSNEVQQYIREAITQRRLVQTADSFMKDGEMVHYLRTILPYFNHEGGIENVFVIGIDITDLKRVENDIIQKNKDLQKINLELDHFVYSISHDLRSPLLSIKGIIGLVLKSSTISDENRKFLDMTMSSASRLDNTIQEILDYSRNSRLDVSNTNFDIKELIAIVFEDLKFAANSEIQIDYTINGSTFINSDKARMGVLLKNIIGNSIKYRRPDVEAKIHVEINAFPNEIKLLIIDNGEGIQPKHLDKVFDMFYRATTTSVGTGLGLYICKEIVQKLGGSISIQSIPGEGTTVSMNIENHHS